MQSYGYRGTVFSDRRDAGARLGRHIAAHRPVGELLILGLPRGGVPVAAEVADALDAPLDVLIVRKLGAPFNPELAIGGIALGGVAVYNERIVEQLGLSDETLETIRHRELEELERRDRAYRGSRPLPSLEGKTVIIVDDGIATGATMYAAAKACRLMHPARVIVAVPTSSIDARDWLEEVADEVIALSTPEPYVAVGAWFERFEQLSDAEVLEILERHRGPESGEA